jgi:hypothetical protein
MTITKEKCFYSGRDNGNKIPQIDPNLFEPYNNDASKLYSLLIVKKYDLRFVFKLSCDLHNLNILITEIYNLDRTIRDCMNNGNFMLPKGTIPQDLYAMLKYRQESLIHMIKKIIDDLVTLSYLKYDIASNDIKIDNFISLLKIRNDKTTKVKSELNINNFEPFLTAINELHNACKHSFLMYETRNLYSPDQLTIVAFSPKDRKRDNIYYLNHTFAQIILGFNDFICDATGYKKNEYEHKYFEFIPNKF